MTLSTSLSRYQDGVMLRTPLSLAAAETRLSRLPADTAQIGRATELRVRAILLERGVTPVLPELDVDGWDVTAAGLTVQVKAARLSSLGQYNFTFRHKKQRVSIPGVRADVAVLRGVDHDLWWVIPAVELDPAVRASGCVSLIPHAPNGGTGRGARRKHPTFFEYLDAWEIFDA